MLQTSDWWPVKQAPLFPWPAKLSPLNWNMAAKPAEAGQLESGKKSEWHNEPRLIESSLSAACPSECLPALLMPSTLLLPFYWLPLCTIGKMSIRSVHCDWLFLLFFKTMLSSSMYSATKKHLPLPNLSFFLFACLSDLHVLEHQTKFNIRHQ